MESTFGKRFPLELIALLRLILRTKTIGLKISVIIIFGRYLQHASFYSYLIVDHIEIKNADRVQSLLSTSGSVSNNYKCKGIKFAVLIMLI